MKCRLAFGVMNDAYQVTSVIEFQVMRLARLVHVEECLLANFRWHTLESQGMPNYIAIARRATVASDIKVFMFMSSFQSRATGQVPMPDLFFMRLGQLCALCVPVESPQMGCMLIVAGLTQYSLW